MHQVPIRLRDCSLNAAKDAEVTNLIANGELRRDLDVTVTERALVLRAADAERCFLLDAEGRSAEIAHDPDAPIEWDQLEWGHEPRVLERRLVRHESQR